MKPLSREQELSLYYTSKHVLNESRGGLISGALRWTGKKLKSMTPGARAQAQQTAQQRATTVRTTQDLIDDILTAPNPHPRGSREYFEVQRLKTLGEQGRGSEILGLKKDASGNLVPLAVGAAGGAAVGAVTDSDSGGFISRALSDIGKSSEKAERAIIGIPSIQGTIERIATDPGEMAGLPQRFRRRGTS
jgi:hypothetical protein